MGLEYSRTILLQLERLATLVSSIAQDRTSLVEGHRSYAFRHRDSPEAK